MVRYKYHKDAKHGVNDEKIKSEEVIFLSFDYWKSLYENDFKNWIIVKNSNYYNNKPYYFLPAYRFNKYIDNKNVYYQYIYIKFLKRKDYMRFLRFIKNINTKGLDNENLNKILKLQEIIEKNQIKDRLIEGIKGDDSLK